MGKATFAQVNFHGGEWSPYSQGRFDREDYRTAMNVCENYIPNEGGALVRRPGTRTIAGTHEGSRCVIRELHFRQANSYVMEFNEDGRLRFVTDGYLVRTGTELTVNSVSTASPALVTTNAAHGLITGDEVEIFYSNSASPNPDVANLTGRQFVVTVTGGTTFTIADSASGENFDGSQISGEGTTTLHVRKILAFDTPFVNPFWRFVNTVQDENVCLALQNAVPPQAIQINVDGSIITFDQADFLDGPYLDPRTDFALTPSAATGAITLDSGANALWAATDVGRLMRLFGEPPVWDAGTGFAAGDRVVYNDGYYTALQATTGNQPDISVAYWAVTPAAAAWTWGEITAFNSATNVDFLIRGGDLPYGTDPVRTWRLGLYCDTLGWPSCGTYHQGRFWLSGVLPNRLDASVPNNQNLNQFSFEPTATDGSVADNNGLSVILKATDVNTVYWLMAIDRGVLAGTQGGEWLIQSSTLNDPITPTDVVANRVTRFRAADVQPIQAPLATLFVQGFNRNLIELVPDGSQGGKYEGFNLAKDAKHITKAGIQRLAYQQETTPIVWALDRLGAVYGASYQRQSPWASQAASYVGWHRHAWESGRTWFDLASGPSADGTLDSVHLVSRLETADDPEKSHRIETFGRFFEEGDNPVTSQFLDHARVPTIGFYTAPPGFGASGSIHFGGLHHLAGEFVSALVCGIWVQIPVDEFGFADVDVWDTQEDSGGDAPVLTSDVIENYVLPGASSVGAAGIDQVYLPGGGGSEGPPNYIVPAWFGFNQIARGQIVRPMTQSETGAQLGPALGKKRIIAEVTFMLADAGRFEMGTSFNEMTQQIFEENGGRRLPEYELFSDAWRIEINDNWSIDGSMICWRAANPYPSVVLAVEGFITTEK